MDLESKLLNKINLPSDLKSLNIKELQELAQELRIKTIATVAKTGGHLGAGLGVIELTIAIHYVFNTPDDRLIWDVGHQSYPHKILTGRKDKIESLRQENGLSGFTKRSESIYDPFGAGHSSTSIAAALGMSAAAVLNNEARFCLAVIGDGAMSAGMAYEALNNAGALKKERRGRLIVILNDNEMSIAPPVGAMSKYLSRLISSKSYFKFRSFLKKILYKFPKSILKYSKKMEKFTKEWWIGGNIFEELGFYYIGPVDGHNINDLVSILNNLKNYKDIESPILIHVITEKGKGYNDIMKSNDNLHAVGKFDFKTGKSLNAKDESISYSSVFADHLLKHAQKDSKIVAITAAMPDGTGLNKFMKDLPKQIFDVGIAEQHAVTFAAGLATEGIKPYVAIYSTFLQRAYDQIIHDVAIQSLPVRFAIDRAGLVGTDGPTHAGSFDISYLSILPNFVVMAPSDAKQLKMMINLSLKINDRPCAFRYPRGASIAEIKAINDESEIVIGKSRVIKEGKDIAIISYGTILNDVMQAIGDVDSQITVIDARFCKPLDEKMFIDVAKKHHFIIAIEEGSVNGFGNLLMKFFSDNGLLDEGNLIFRSLNMKDSFVDQSSNIDAMKNKAGIGINDLQNLINDFLQKSKNKPKK